MLKTQIFTKPNIILNNPILLKKKIVKNHVLYYIT